MSIDDGMARDPRVRKVAKITGELRQTTAGRLLDVWSICYDRLTAILPADDIDIAAELDGFADAMVRSGLATVVAARGATAPADLRLAGAEERIAYLLSCRDRGSMGGKAKAANARAQSSSATAELQLSSSYPLPCSGSGSGIGAPANHHVDQPPPGINNVGVFVADPGGGFNFTPEASGLLQDGRSAGPAQDGVADRLWARQESIRREVIPGARALKATPDRLRRIDMLIRKGLTEVELGAVLDGYRAEALRNPDSAKWINGETNWRPGNVDRQLGGVGAVSEQQPPRRGGLTAADLMKAALVADGKASDDIPF